MIHSGWLVYDLPQMPVFPQSPCFNGSLIVQIQVHVTQNTTCPCYCTISIIHVSQWADLFHAAEGLPATVLEAGRACRAMSGWEVLCTWSPGICWSLGVDILCCPPSVDVGGTSKGCWEGTEVGGRCGGLIFSAMSCSLILLISTRLSNWEKVRSTRWFWHDEQNLCLTL